MAAKLVSKIETSLRRKEDKKKAVRDYATSFLAGIISVPAGDVKGVEKNHDGKSCEMNLRTLNGTYVVDETTWLVLGMLPGSYSPREPPRNQTKSPAKSTPTGLTSKDPLPMTLEYSVLQVPQTFKLAGKDVTEIMTKSKKEHILRICFSDNKEMLGQFRQETKLFKIMRKKYGYNKRFYDKFPRILADGEFGKLKGLISRSENKNWFYEPRIPKPFHVMEKVGPTLEEFRLCQRIPNKITPHCSVFLLLGCIAVLRLVHEAGVAVCDVRPSSFCIRLGPTLTLHRSESELIGLVALTHLGRARLYRTQHFDIQSTWAGTRKYISPEVMNFEPPGPVDDMISCLYMLYEFLAGELPWAQVERNGIIKILTDENILTAKEQLEKVDEIDDGEKTNKQGAAFLHLNQVFAEIRKANGYDEPINYDEVNRLLLAGISHREDKDRGRSTFAFHQPSMFCYRHGIELKDDRDAKGSIPKFPEDAKTGEDRDIRLKANRLYPCTKDKRKEEEDRKGSKKSVSSKRGGSKKK